MKTRELHVIVITAAAVFGCTSKRTVGAEQHRGALKVSDGTYEFYAGKGVGALLAQGLSVPDDYPNAFMSLTVKEDFIDAMNASGRRVRTVSFEAPDTSIEATVHQFKERSTERPTELSTELETLRFHPGDPWVTGYAQVGFGPDDFLIGLFYVVKWNKDTSGTMPGAFGQEIHTTGLLDDPEKPPLNWANNPRSAPLPDNWQ